MSTINTSPARAGATSWSDDPFRHLLRVSIVFLQKVFEAAPEGEYRFNANDPAAGNLMITSDIPVDAEQIGERPHIAVYFGPTQWQGVGLDQLRSENMMTGEREHQDTITGNLMISVLSRNGAEAQYLAFVVSFWFWILRRVLLKLGFHDIGQRMSVSAPTSPGELVNNDSDGEIIAVHAIAPFQTVWSVKVNERGNHLLESIEVTLQTTLPEDFPSAIERHSIPLGIIGSATERTDGSSPRIGFDRHASVIPDLRERRQYEIAGNMDDPVTERIERTITIKE